MNELPEDYLEIEEAEIALSEILIAIHDARGREYVKEVLFGLLEKMGFENYT